MRRFRDVVFPSSCPPAVPCSGAPFAPQGPPGEFPCFSTTMRHSDFPSLVSRGFLLIPVIPPMHPLFAPGRIDAPHHRAGVISCRGFPNRVSVSGRNGTSQVPGEPPCTHAPLSDPGGTFQPGRLGSPVLPSAFWTASASTLRYFGALSRGLSAPCLRFAARVAPVPRKTRFRLSASFAGGVWLLPGFLREVSDSLRHIFLLAQASLGAPKIPLTYKTNFPHTQPT